MSSSTRDLPLIPVLVGTTLLSIVTTAWATHVWTKRREDMKYQAIANRQYEREKMLKHKISLVRQQDNEPPAGTLLSEVRIDKVFLWECVDLRKRFPPALIPNAMKLTRQSSVSKIRSPLLRRASSSIDGAGKKSDKAVTVTTEYNKLITDHECILADVVRKPNMPTHTVAYMRAGPR